LSHRQRQSPSAFLRQAIFAAPLLALTLLPACSNIALLPQEDAPATGAEPAYAKLVADHIGATFKNRAGHAAYEISGPRWVHALRGWNWLVCVRFQDRGGPRTYAVFIKEGAVVDSRYAVQTDACDLQGYAPFDMMNSTMGPTSVGAQEPIY
jgi:hypothetical protein